MKLDEALKYCDSCGRAETDPLTEGYGSELLTMRETDAGETLCQDCPDSPDDEEPLATPKGAAMSIGMVSRPCLTCGEDVDVSHEIVECVRRMRAEIARLREELAAVTRERDEAREARDENRDRIEIEKLYHEETRGYRQHAEQLCAEQKARAEAAEKRVAELEAALGEIGQRGAMCPSCDRSQDKCDPSCSGWIARKALAK